MRAGDLAKFTVGLKALATVFRFDLTEAIIEGYWQGLEDVELAAIGRAMRRAWRECRFMPTPAELRDFAGRGKDARPYHAPYRPTLTAAEKKRIRESWIGPERQLETAPAARDFSTTDPRLPRERDDEEDQP